MREELEALLERWPLGARLDLPANSNVVIVGAYKGITMELIDELYHPELIIGYEPQPWAFKVALEVVMAHGNMEVYNLALGDKAQLVEMGEWETDACSLVNKGPQARKHGQAMMVPADWSLSLINHIDLMIMNIEGYEYTLLPYMRAHDILRKTERLAVQWHLDLAPGLDEDMMDNHIQQLIVGDDYVLRIDERPSWTYMTKVKS